MRQGQQAARLPGPQPGQGGGKRDGQPVKGGVVQFTPDPDKPEFLINSEVGADGMYTLSTVRTTDSKGERKTGAPAGAYKVTYTPSLGDQTAGGQTGPVKLGCQEWDGNAFTSLRGCESFTCCKKWN